MSWPYRRRRSFNYRAGLSRALSSPSPCKSLRNAISHPKSSGLTRTAGHLSSTNKRFGRFFLLFFFFHLSTGRFVCFFRNQSEHDRCHGRDSNGDVRLFTRICCRRQQNGVDRLNIELTVVDLAIYAADNIRPKTSRLVLECINSTKKKI